ncbi:hypothetical protein EYF80_012365 [Liparis tanakae]|uniref:Uncharacterized protein n=1 Tax=Liparis tanakae TaxID=230148 RepID=A0A4Z2II47_9TELE|nr:hypothetical protein EYF80_012365 [Liparis tanakae]
MEQYRRLAVMQLFLEKTCSPAQGPLKEASAKYIFTVKPLPNLHKEDLQTKYRVITRLSVESATLQVKLSTKNHRGKRIGGCVGRVGRAVVAEQRDNFPQVPLAARVHARARLILWREEE